MVQSIASSQPVASPIEIKGTASLKNGKILFGKVNKVFLNQTAEVQFGHQKMVATLDIPLRTGVKYWFQVQQPIEWSVVLKALDSPNLNVSGLNGTVAQLIAHLSIKPEPAATKLAEYLLTNRLPITKETFRSALQWLKAADAAEVGLPVIKTMFIQQLPFVKGVFDALFTQSKGEPFQWLQAAAGWWGSNGDCLQTKGGIGLFTCCQTEPASTNRFAKTCDHLAEF
ncbi:hypothetical protein P4576_10165 [Peribacillus frigoritolerans]|uniref:hypothetical protein n=1 Tax=Peribacillus frigoritolerans TaxID=450367 RepID=UPI002E24D61A|nr:hypothetical protein [Peribacillus frigoritolerans]